jgi:PTH1 family peptidyl-tRNA hydrolase
VIQRIIAGLGNPGAEYEGTRHNAGFVALDRLAAELSVRVSKLKFKALVGEGVIRGVSVLLVKPAAFMNLSGDSVAEAARFYGVPPERVIVIYDDCALPLGKLRVRERGSAGGHNGVKSVIQRLNTDAFARIRIGVGEKPERWDLTDYVLSRFSKNEAAVIETAAEKAAEAARLIVSEGAEAAMNRFNGGQPPEAGC